MGGPKALMRVAGSPWWRTQCARLAAWQIPALWVVSPQVRDALALERDAPNMVTADPDAPMFASLAAGLRHLAEAPPRAVYLLPVDVPACSPACIAAFGAHSTQPEVPTVNGKGGHPVRLPWSFVETHIGPHLANPDAHPGVRLDHLLADHAAHCEVSDLAVITNLNTPEAVETWLTSQVQ